MTEPALYLGAPVEQVALLIADEGESFEVMAPGRSEAEGIAFLEWIGTGALGSGVRMTRLGYALPTIRQQYEARLAELFRRKGPMEVDVAAGRMSKEHYAHWLFEQRRGIAYAARHRQGLASLGLLEIRDWTKYGVGGRSWRNIYGRAVTKAASESVKAGITIDPLDRVIKTATTPNVAISDAAIRGAKLLKRAGPLFVAAGAVLDGYEIYTAPEGQRSYVAGRVGSEAAGGFVGGGLGVGICIAFGIATSGWGLLACAAVGGLGGGYLGDKVYQSVDPQKSLKEVEETGMMDGRKLVPYGAR